jgi:hypothetical protein
LSLSGYLLLLWQVQGLGFEVDVNTDGGLEDCFAMWYFAVSTFGRNKIPPVFRTE